jgi:Mg2+-importing ATPase
VTTQAPLQHDWLAARDAASLTGEEAVSRLQTSADGLTSDEAARRRAIYGPNAVRSHHARATAVLVRQLRSPLLLLLFVAALISFFVGERSDAVIIGIIMSLSIGLGFANEYRAELAAQALHSQLRHRTVVKRDAQWIDCDVTEIVPGDVVRLTTGSIVPADVRLLTATELECGEAVLTGEAAPVEKGCAPVATGTPLDALTSCAFMGTVVTGGSGEAIVTATGGQTEFGRIALALGERQDDTEFQNGLRQFSLLLARVAGVLTTAIFVINLVLQRPLIDALLFSLAIAVGITPQLLPAVVTTSLATGSRRLAQRKVLVKRLVCIEDLGNIEVLFTDKTGTLTEGTISFEESVDASGSSSTVPVLLGLVCNEASVEHGRAVGGNPLDLALWDAPGAAGLGAEAYHQIAVLPFDHERCRVSVVSDGPDGRVLVTKGAPEEVMALCRDVPSAAHDVVESAFEMGRRVVAVGCRPAPGLTTLTSDDECDFAFIGFLSFLDKPKTSARASLARLAELGVAVRVLTGDNGTVAEHVCQTLGLEGGATLSGADVDRLDDAELSSRLGTTRVFARMDPEQKTRVVRLQRAMGTDVAYLGDGVNDAVSLHAADVGISVDTATDVARDAADIVLLEKDLNVLADGVVEGRRIFANTIKYVLMGTSSNFGNMFSAAAASAFLPFLPMLPSQILLNNLLYDASQITIPSDRVDEEQLARPAHWDIAFIRRFMVHFGPISSIFDFLTFAVMLNVFDAGPRLFRTGWFVESLATQALVIFVIRTRRSPFWHSRPSALVTASTFTVVVIAAVLPYSPAGATLGFTHLPAGFFAFLCVMVVAYLLLVEVAKREFFAHLAPEPPSDRRARERRVSRRAARFSHPGPLGPQGHAS